MNAIGKKKSRERNKKQEAEKKWQQKISHCGCNLGSVTRLGDLLDFGQVFKAFGNN